MKRTSSLVFALAVIALVATLLLSTVAIAQEPVHVVYGPAQILMGGDEETPQIVVDSMGNAHIVWSGLGGTYLFYKMVDPNGVILIEETNLLPSDDPISQHVRRPALALDSSGVTKFLTRVTYFNGAVDPAYWAWPASSGRSPDLAVSPDRVFITFHGVLATDGDENGEDGWISDIYLVILGPAPVGGDILPVNTLTLLAPALLLLLTAATAIVVALARSKRL